jgi:hypothetical protein
MQMQGLVRQVVLALALFSPLPALACQSAPVGLDGFVAQWQGPVYDALGRIYAQPAPTDENRFLIVSFEGQRYVQCHFQDEDRLMYCEASSGFYGPVDVNMRFTPEKLAAIAGQGFSLDGSHGNFVLDDMPVTGLESLRDIACRMVVTLYEGYGPADRPVKLKGLYVSPDERPSSAKSVPATALSSPRCDGGVTTIATVSGDLRVMSGPLSRIWWQDDEILQLPRLRLLETYPAGAGRPSLVTFIANQNHPAGYTGPVLYLIDMDTVSPADHVVEVPLQLSQSTRDRGMKAFEFGVQLFADRFYVFTGSPIGGGAELVSYVYDAKQKVLVRQGWKSRLPRARTP